MVNDFMTQILKVYRFKEISVQSPERVNVIKISLSKLLVSVRNYMFLYYGKFMALMKDLETC